MPEKRWFYVQGEVTYEDEVEVYAETEEEAREIGSVMLSNVLQYVTRVHVTKVYEWEDEDDV